MVDRSIATNSSLKLSNFEIYLILDGILNFSILFINSDDNDNNKSNDKDIILKFTIYNCWTPNYFLELRVYNASLQILESYNDSKNIS